MPTVTRPRAWRYTILAGGMMITKQGPIKTFPLRGIKESPPYLHDGRLLTLEDFETLPTKQLDP